MGGVYEVDKTSGGTVTRTVTYYPTGGATLAPGASAGVRINISGGSNSVYYLLKDHLGSASVVTDASGNTVGEQRYYAYGETRLSTGSIYTDKLFTGQREMAGLGIYHYNARFYSPKLGRFLSADTIVPNPYNPQDLNRFSYGLNNPSRYSDPSGHAAVSETEAGCSGGGPACIMDMWSGYDDADHMMASLRNWVRYHKDYDPVTDNKLSDEEKATVSVAMFQVVVEDTPKDASLSDILKNTFSSAALIGIFGIINEGINMSPDDNGGGGGWSTDPTWTKKMLSESEVIAQGYNIRDVERLAQTYGGNPKNWKKMKGWDENGQEWHWYYHPDVGRVEVKPK